MSPKAIEISDEKTPLVSVVILNFNGGDDTIHCLASVLNETVASVSFEVIVVDNGSTDDSAVAIARQFPQIKLIETGSNLGFSRGANLGAAAASGEFVAFLNNDVRVDSEWLSPLVDLLRGDVSLAAAGCTIMSWEGTVVEFSGRRGDAFSLSYLPAANPVPDHPKPMDGATLFASGGGCLYRRTIFDALGGFDPAYFMYQEDVDLGWRGWVQGHASVMSARSIIYHKGGGTSRLLTPEFIQTLSTKHVLASVFKNLGAEELTKAIPVLLTYLDVRASATKAEAVLESALKGFEDMLTGLVESRKKIQGNRAVSDEKIFELVGHPLLFLYGESSLATLADRLLATHNGLDPADAESVQRSIRAWLPRIHALRQAATEAYQMDRALQQRMMRLETTWRDERLVEREAGITYLRQELLQRDERLAALEEKRIVDSRDTQQMKEDLTRYEQFAGVIADLSREMGLSHHLYDPRYVRQPTIPTNLLAAELQPAPSSKHDVVCFSIIDWEFRWQRPQQIISQFADHGHRVFYLSISRTVPTDGPRCAVRPLRDNVWEVQLSVPARLDVYGGELSREMVTLLLDDLRALRNTFNISTAVSIVQVATWSALAYAARQQFGWLIVYDCMDEWDTFPGMSHALLSAERRLVRDADLLVVTAQKLYEKYAPLRSRTILVRNGTNFELFQEAEPHDLLSDVPHPVVGYFGAIADWFDIELAVKMCRERPNYSFVFLGGVFDVSLSELTGLSNVFLLGQQPYETMPLYLSVFDVCIIPFKVNAITEATDPVKFYEYISQGKPVVASRMPELFVYDDLLYIADGSEDFIRKLDVAIRENDPSLIERRIALARRNSWKNRFDLLAGAIADAHQKASVVVVSYNNLALTKACLESVLRKTQHPNLEIVVVDNASADGTGEYLARLAKDEPRLKIILNEENFGFAKANNQGLQVCTGEYLVLLNNDTVVPRSWLSKLLSHLHDSEIGLVNSVTNFSGNESRVEVTYTDLSGMEEFAERYTREHEGEIFDIRVAAMYCLAMRRDTWERLGPLDENFGIGMFEDDDYSHRARIAGYRVVCAEDAFVHHYGQASFKKLSSEEYEAAWQRNQVYFQQKWGITWKPHEGRKTHRKAAKLPERLQIELFFAHLQKKHEFERLRTEKEHEIQGLHKELGVRQEYIDRLAHENFVLRASTEQIYSSRLWKVGEMYWNLGRIMKRRPAIAGDLRARMDRVGKVEKGAARFLRGFSKLRLRSGGKTTIEGVRGVARFARSLFRSPVQPDVGKGSLRITSANAKRARKNYFDVLCFPIIDWSFRVQRPQQIMAQFGQAGHRVFYIALKLRDHGDEMEIREVARNVYEVSLVGAHRDAYVQTMTPRDVSALLSQLRDLVDRFEITSAASILQLPYWAPLATELKKEWGWPVVYDCMDNLAGFSTNPKQMIRREMELLSQADLVTVSSAWLADEAAKHNSNVLVLRNACEYEHFATRVHSPHQETGSRPLIGYYGAIADWFDTELVLQLAKRHPDWDFVLIGSTVLGDVTTVRKLKNVLLTGERSYDELPLWLERFDVAIIPFRRTPLTEATNPVKAYEMLAAGKPIVSVPLPEVALLAPLVRLASTVDEFEKEIAEALVFDYEPMVIERRRAFARANTWQGRLTLLLPRIEALFPRTSVIVSGVHRVAACAVSILESTDWPHYEILLTGGAEREPLERPQDALDARMIEIPDKGTAVRSINEALLQARGDYVIIVDENTVMKRGWISSSVSALNKDPVTAVIVAGLDPSPGAGSEMAVSDLEPLSDLTVVALRREVFELVGPFDEQFESFAYAASDWLRRVASSRFQWIHQPLPAISEKGPSWSTILPSDQTDRSYLAKERQPTEDRGEYSRTAAPGRFDGSANTP